MTYFGFLAIFLGMPLVVLTVIILLDVRHARRLPEPLCGFPFWLAVTIHVIVALVYTTPWDNYLVATGVWYYDPKFVTGITLGWVPIEEYTFFVLQTVVTGLWMRVLAIHLPIPSRVFRGEKKARLLPLVAFGGIWFVAFFGLVASWKSATYLNLILCWAIPPIMLQFLFGGDILYYYRRFVLLAFVVPTLYISLADSLAISMGIWTINPIQSLNIFLCGILPLEEFVFFLATNTLISLGISLFLTRQSHARVIQIYSAWFSNIIGNKE